MLSFSFRDKLFCKISKKREETWEKTDATIFSPKFWFILIMSMYYVYKHTPTHIQHGNNLRGSSGNTSKVTIIIIVKYACSCFNSYFYPYNRKTFGPDPFLTKTKWFYLTCNYKKCYILNANIKLVRKLSLLAWSVL